MDNFNYVIARLWSEDDIRLNCYTFHSTVFYGDMKDAQNTLEFIKNRVDEDKSSEFKIYKINDEPLK
jgi:hypothetical protein